MACSGFFVFKRSRTLRSRHRMKRLLVNSSEIVEGIVGRPLARILFTCSYFSLLNVKVNILMGLNKIEVIHLN